jgi:hypothetical protein
MRRHRRRARDDRAAERLAAAEREVELSRRRLREAHEEVIGPLRGYAERNNFAAIIAASLTRGHGGAA